jgi:hypothetical protein
VWCDAGWLLEAVLVHLLVDALALTLVERWWNAGQHRSDRGRCARLAPREPGHR